MRYFKLYLYFLKMNIKSLFEYKIDMIFSIISIFIWVGSGLVNLGIIYSNLSEMKGWSLSEVGFLYGMWSLTFAIYNAFGNSVFDIEDYVLTGKMDSMLAKPISPLFHIIAKRFNIMGVGFLLFGISAIVFFAQYVDVTWNFVNTMYITISSLLGGLLIFSTYLLCSCLSFIFVKSNTIISIGFDIHKFSQYPLCIYGKWVQAILVSIFPYAFSNYIPVAVILGKINSFYGIISPVVCILFFIIALLVWNKGLKKYEGTGS